MTDVLSRELRDGVAWLRAEGREEGQGCSGEVGCGGAEQVGERAAGDGGGVVVRTGDGSSFCAGADMTEALDTVESGGRGDGMAQAVVRVMGFAKPAIACINGPAFGGGAALALACDISIASERAAFRFPGANYGLVVSGSQLPRLVGAAMAKELIFTARVIEAEEAERIGLVNRVVPHDRLDETVWELARQIAQQSPNAVRWSKAVIDAATASDQGVALDAEANRAAPGAPEGYECPQDTGPPLAPVRREDHVRRRPPQRSPARQAGWE